MSYFRVWKYIARGDVIMTLHELIDTSLHLIVANTSHLQGHSFKLFKQSAQKLIS